MHYSEAAPPPELAHLIKAAWALDCAGGPGDLVRHSATPDGCVEIIHRTRGRSIWQTEQPQAFVAGVITKPATLQFMDGASFVGLRLWPWAWNAIAEVASPAFVDTWLPLEIAAPALRPPSSNDIFSTFPSHRVEIDDIGTAILRSGSVAGLAERTGRSHRWLQRWFARTIGVPPRAYLRLLRFQDALQDVQASGSSLADQAAAHGYADQAHMTREFKSLAGAPTGAARRTARGPFV